MQLRFIIHAKHSTENNPPTTTFKSWFNFQAYFKISGKDFFKSVTLVNSIHLKTTELRARKETDLVLAGTNLSPFCIILTL